MACCLTKSPTRLFILSLLLQLVSADVVCYEDGFGHVDCRNRLPFPIRVAIGIVIALGVIALITGAGVARRRRMRRYNLNYVNNYYPNQGQSYYPQQTYEPPPGNQHLQAGYQPGYAGYPPNSNHQSVNGVPPAYHPPSYAPPVGAPPPAKQ